MERTKAPLFLLTLLAIVELTAAISSTNLGNGLLYSLDSTQDTWVYPTQGGGNNALIVGKHPQYPKKRFLIEFENLPSRGCKFVKWAKMYVYFWYAHKASWQSVQSVPYIERDLAVHQVKKPWKEYEVTSINSQSGAPWSQPYLALDDSDAATYSQDTVTIFTGRPAGYVEFDITEAMRNWKNGQPNYGLLVWATNEDVDGRDLRFYSRNNNGNNPQVKVLCN